MRETFLQVFAKHNFSEQLIYKALFCGFLVNDQEHKKIYINHPLFVFGSSGAVHPALQGLPLDRRRDEGRLRPQTTEKTKGRF